MFLFLAVFAAMPGSAEESAGWITLNGMACREDVVVIRFRKASVSARVLASDRRDLVARLGLPDAVTMESGGFTRWKRERVGLASGPEDGPIDPDSYQLLRLRGRLSVEACLDRLASHPLLEYAVPSGIGFTGSTAPSDPNYASQWHHPRIRTPDAWDFTQGSTGVIVAVLDTGLNMTLSEFTNRLVAGYDFAYNDADPSDDTGHGTAVTGALGAHANNGVLVAGVDWHCRIMPVKVFNNVNWGDYVWWADGLNYAVANGAKVVNLSAGGSGFSPELDAAISNAVAAGVIFVTITHNQGSSTITYPGNRPDTIAVGATETNDTRASFSNYGPEIDLVAPGRDICTVGASGGLEYWWGTSQAAPQVAGVVALMAALRPDIDHETARALLCAGADDRVGEASDTPGFDIYYGWGRLNAFHSILLARTTLRAATNDTSVLEWTGPTNAVSKTPYRIMESRDLAEGFQPVSWPITYVGTQASFRIPSPTHDHACYRLDISTE